MIVRTFLFDVELTKPLYRYRSNVPFAMNDKKANRIIANVLQNGQAVDLTGYTVKGYYIRCSLDTIKFSGVVSGNKAILELPEECYKYDGTYTLTIKLCNEESEIALVMVVGRVLKTATDNIIDVEGEPLIVTLNVDEEGKGLLEGATLMVDAEGNGTLVGATLSVNQSGDGTIS